MRASANVFTAKIRRDELKDRLLRALPCLQAGPRGSGGGDNPQNVNDIVLVAAVHAELRKRVLVALRGGRLMAEVLALP